jgi:hypothetical protein
VSRDYLARLLIRDHRADRLEEIRAAVCVDPQMGHPAPVERHAATDLIFDLSFTMYAGWRANEKAKDLTWRVGQANGGPCRVEWTSRSAHGEDSDSGEPELRLVFYPEHFPVGEPQFPLQPSNWMLRMHPFAGCGYCASKEDTIILGTWRMPKEWLSDGGSVGSRANRLETVLICHSCRQLLRDRLAPATDVTVGLFETDGNPSGLPVVNPDLACMACSRRVTETMLVMNDSQLFWLCRGCVTGASGSEPASVLVRSQPARPRPQRLRRPRSTATMTARRRSLQP